MSRLVFALLLVLLLVPPAAAEPGRPEMKCPLSFEGGFGQLYTAMGGDAPSLVGWPLSCQLTDADGTTVQLTARGVFYQRADGAPTFTDGYMHWGLAADGALYWFGASLEPTADAELMHSIDPSRMRP